MCSATTPPAIEMAAFRDLVLCWFAFTGRSPDDLTAAQLGELEQTVGEETFDLIAEEVERMTLGDALCTAYGFVKEAAPSAEMNVDAHGEQSAPSQGHKEPPDA